MDWTQFLEIVAGPAYLILLTAAAWAYRDLRNYTRSVESKSTETAEKLRTEMNAMTIEIMKQYVPKDDVLRLENRLMDAISKIDEKLERIISK